MFKKILIANRGEIAVRIIRACHSLKIKTVAVYSRADEYSPHVKLADESYFIGESQVNKSYLNIEKIIEIANTAKAEAIHPGYGLLSENEDFSKRAEMNGITFIGPSAKSMEQMSNKIKARKVMEKAGVPVVPGSSTPLFNLEEAKNTANKIGYPIMLKASSGGGGIGMQIVNNQEELIGAFSGNQKRATDFFGNGEMFIEQLVSNPRHIEIQILADQRGNTISLGERECSIQRRHQKVIEEAPSPFIDEETRKKMGEDAVRAAKAIDYINAGTVEFVMDENKNYYFLEMNTRLQVEHPITEEITGIDLVKKQIEIAYGKTLKIKQDEVQLNGHAIEVRIYAEDPKTFFPSPGKITNLNIPTGQEFRHELAVEKGFTVTPFYDPMIGKMIVKDANREKAIKTMISGLENYKVDGIKTNVLALLSILRHNEFKKGNTTTNFIYKYL